MATNSKIEWCDHTVNLWWGCAKVHTGCKNCYAERMSKRLAGRFGYPPAPDNFRVALHFDKINEPLKWKKPRRIFVVSMGDLFHEYVPFEVIDRIFTTIINTPQHTYQILTKRPERMRDYFSTIDIRMLLKEFWPFPNVWLGVSVENQETANERIPILLEIPAKVKFVSVEPMLSHVNLVNIPYNSLGALHKMNALIGYGGWRNYNRMEYKLHWIICGSESGPNARPTETEWVRSIRNQCIDAGVPFFLKQLHINGKKVSMPELDGKVWDEMPR